MKVFISWSGEVSKKHAEAIRAWLPNVLQAVQPYFTPSDVEKGSRWGKEIAAELEASEVGILCVTRDNLHSDWVMFEAGALSKTMDRAHVCPVLFGIDNSDLAGPLQQFQTTNFEKEDFRKLVNLVNNKLTKGKLEPTTLDTVFEKWWPDLEEAIAAISGQAGGHDGEPVRSDREILVEILELTRLRVRRPEKSMLLRMPSELKDLAGQTIELAEILRGDDGNCRPIVWLQMLQLRDTLVAFMERYRTWDANESRLRSALKRMHIVFDGGEARADREDS